MFVVFSMFIMYWIYFRSMFGQDLVVAAVCMRQGSRRQSQQTQARSNPRCYSDMSLPGAHVAGICISKHMRSRRARRSKAHQSLPFASQHSFQVIMCNYAISGKFVVCILMAFTGDTCAVHHEGHHLEAHCSGSVVVLEPWLPLSKGNPRSLPDVHSQWPSPDGDVKHFKCYRAIRALWRFAMMAAHKDVETEQTGTLAKTCQSHQSTVRLDAGTHCISKDVATGRLVMLSMAASTVPCGSCGGWHAFSNVLSDSGNWFTILRDP